mmetsp:Transcript_58424/g.153848  ORF Transcript_58424/g.153848 Transcript_58424/m.153848 type:complete len:395 (+) Transcript_58424:66-1250(+)
MARFAMLFLGAAVVVDGAWNPANGTKELDAVEAALHKIVDMPSLSPAQVKMARKTVADVDQIVAQIQASEGLTKQAKMQKVGQALRDLQDLQGQFELNAVQQALHKMTEGHMTSEVAKSAKDVAESVDKVAEELESGKNMTKEQKNKMVGDAVQKLQGLQGLFEKSLSAAGNATAGAKLQSLEKELSLKKAELAREEDVLKLAKLQKELAVKTEELRELESKKSASKASSQGEEKDARQQEQMVAKLVGMAKELKAAKGGAKKEDPAAKAELPVPIKAILTNLQGRAATVSASLAKMDAEEKAREAKADEAADEASHGKDAKKAQKLTSMLKFLAKEEKHTFGKLRAAKARNLKELAEAVRSVETGDVAAVQKVMQEMQSDVKSSEAKSHNFLY